MSVVLLSFRASATVEVEGQGTLVWDDSSSYFLTKVHITPTLWATVCGAETRTGRTQFVNTSSTVFWAVMQYSYWLAHRL